MMRILRKGERYALSKPVKTINYLSIYNRKSGLVTLLISLFCFQFVCFAQSSRLGGTTGIGEIKPLQIGDTIPEELWHMPLQVVNHPDGKDTITLNDYRGKLLILDFWATYCGSCINAFPKLLNLSESYKEDLYLLPITRQPKEKIEDFLLGRGRDFKERFTYIVDASDVETYFPHTVIPHIVVLANDKVHHLETAATMDGEWVKEILATSKSETL